MNQTHKPQFATAAQSAVVRAPALATSLFLSFLAAAFAQTNYQRIKSFGFPEFSGGGPSSALIEGNDGKLYGTDSGTAFKLNRDGSSYMVLHRFGSIAGDGLAPNGLVEASDGALYGTTRYGGSSDGGTVFKLNKDGSGYVVLRSFSGSVTAESVPNGLVIGSDGALYGTTTLGGDMGLGTAFKLFSSPPQIVFASIQLGGTATLLTLAGAAPGQTCRIQAATNLNAPFWQIIGTNAAGIDGKVQFLDTDASNYPARFYRTAIP